MRDKLGRFVKGHTPWHKGKPLPSWYKEILSKAKENYIPWNKGKKLPQFSGKNNPFYGKKHSEESKRKMSKSLKGKFIGQKSSSWKGGKYSNTQGYILVYSPNHPFKDCRGYVRRSHLVMEKMIGRYLLPEEVIHHKGTKYPLGSIKNKQDDRKINLQLFSNNSEHLRFHKSLH